MRLSDLSCVDLLGLGTSLGLLDAGVDDVTLALDALRGDKTLDLGSLGGLLNLATDDKLSDVFGL